jgi:hypothetical protein
MGKKTKAHRAKVAKRNKAIQDQGKALTKAYLKAREARELETNRMMVQEGIKGEGFLELNGSDADKY